MQNNTCLFCLKEIKYKSTDIKIRLMYDAPLGGKY